MRVAIVGSRNCENLKMRHLLPYLPKECTHILSGGARGVDRLARDLAEYLHIAYTEYRPDYNTFGKGAPLIRNEKIVGNAQLVLAFWDFSSAGTRYTIRHCLKKHIPVRVISIEEACGQNVDVL